MLGKKGKINTKKKIAIQLKEINQKNYWRRKVY